MKIQKQIDICLIKKHPVNTLRLVQFDTGIQLVFNVLDFAIPSGVTATLYVRKRSGKFVYQEKGITVSGNTVTVDLENQALTEYGESFYQLKLKSGADVISTYSSSMWIDRSLADADAEESETVVAAFEELTAEQIAEIEAATDRFTEEARQSVADKGIEVLATIPTDYTETAKRADEANRQKADAIICTETGSEITVTDSSDDYVRNLKIFGRTTQIRTTGKNLVPMFTDYSAYGITMTVKNDGTIVLNGTATGSAFSYVIPLNVVAGNYAFSLNNKTVIGDSWETSPYIAFRDDSMNWVISCTCSAVNRKGTSVTTKTLTSLLLAVPVGIVLNNFELKIQLEAGTEATEYEPYSGGAPSPSPEYPQELESVGREVSTSVEGLNLFDESQISYATNSVGTTSEAYGVVQDGVLIAKMGYHNYGIIWKPFAMSLGAGTYTISADCYIPTGGAPNLNVVVRLYDVKTQAHTSATTVSLSAFDKWERISVQITVTAASEYMLCAQGVGNAALSSNMDVRLKNISIVRADFVESASYEPYKTPQQLITTTPNGLCGIPVASGGNYTAKNGQQWICDEVDFERGVLIQRVRNVTFDGSDDEAIGKNDGISLNDNYLYYIDVSGHEHNSGVCLCDKLIHNSALAFSNSYSDARITTHSRPNHVIYFNVGCYLTENSNDAVRRFLSENPLTIHYGLKTPIETALTAEEIEAYKALRTNYHTTILSNDNGADMELKYNADTKIYIDNKFAELAAAYLKS